MTQSLETEPQNIFSTREIAQRNRDSCGERLSNVMKTAATARELAQKRARHRDA
jgi:hypothetical protein